MNKKLKALFAVGLLAFSFQMMHGQNLIQNGGFESFELNGDFPSDASPWQSSGHALIIGPNLGRPIGTEGNYSITLGAFNVPDSSLWQNFSLLPGEYYLSFDYMANANGVGGKKGSLSATVSSEREGELFETVVSAISPAFLLNGSEGFESYLLKFQVPPDSGKLEIRFADVSPAGGNAVDAVIDNVILSAEPAAGRIIQSISNPELNRQTSLYEQTLVLRNNTTVPLHSVKITLSPQENIEVYNRFGKDPSGMPFVTIKGPILAGNSVEARIEHFSTDRITVPQSAFSLSAGADFETPQPQGALLEINRSFQIATGQMAVEFNSAQGRRYTVEYSNDLSEWKPAQPSIVASGSKTVWIDSGPPKTEPKPVSGIRYYRVTEH